MVVMLFSVLVLETVLGVFSPVKKIEKVDMLIAEADFVRQQGNPTDFSGLVARAVGVR